MERNTRLDAMLGAIQRKRNLEVLGAAVELLAFKASGDAPFFDDVLREMLALSKLTGDRGQQLSVEDLYERACWANPDVRALLLRKAVREAEAVAMRMLTETAVSPAQNPKKTKPKRRKR